MEKRIIGWGAAVGALAGLLSFIFARLLAEPVIDRAIDYESGRDDAKDALAKAAGAPMDMGGPDIFSRGVQSTIGIGFGLVMFGIAMGALFAVVYCLFLGRAGKTSLRNLALLVAGGMFVAMYGVPFLKYPANPPSIGNPDTIKERTGLFVGMIVITTVVLIAAIWLRGRLVSRFDGWIATILAAVAFIVVMGAVMLLLPSLGHLRADELANGDHVTETPLPLTDPAGRIVYPGFPADDLYLFRLLSFGNQVLLWTVIGLGFATVVPRIFGREAAEASDGAATAVPVV